MDPTVKTPQRLLISMASGAEITGRKNALTGLPTSEGYPPFFSCHSKSTPVHLSCKISQPCLLHFTSNALTFLNRERSLKSGCPSCYLGYRQPLLLKILSEITYRIVVWFLQCTPEHIARRKRSSPNKRRQCHPIPVWAIEVATAPVVGPSTRFPFLDWP